MSKLNYEVPDQELPVAVATALSQYDRMVSIAHSGGSLFVLYESGRLFVRDLDSRASMNLPNQVQMYKWSEVKGPLD